MGSIVNTDILFDNIFLFEKRFKIPLNIRTKIKLDKKITDTEVVRTLSKKNSSIKEIEYIEVSTTLNPLHGSAETAVFPLAYPKIYRFITDEVHGEIDINSLDTHKSIKTTKYEFKPMPIFKIIQKIMEEHQKYCIFIAENY